MVENYTNYWYNKENIVCVCRRGVLMISYNKLWKILIDRGMNKSDLRKLVGMSSGSLAKLGKNEPVSMDIILSRASKVETGMMVHLILSVKR